MQTSNKYMFYKSAINEKTCKQIIAYGLSKMQVDENAGISKLASTFDGKEKGGVSIKGKKTSSKVMAAGMTKISMKKKGIDIGNNV